MESSSTIGGSGFASEIHHLHWVSLVDPRFDSAFELCIPLLSLYGMSTYAQVLVRVSIQYELFEGVENDEHSQPPFPWINLFNIHWVFFGWLGIEVTNPGISLSEDVADIQSDHLAEDEFDGRYLIFLSIKEGYFNELGVLFEDVIALLSKFPGAVLSYVACDKKFCSS
ncbi:hypothetical protein CsatB_012131 [Cannabis sativa]